jgi:GT2 family glycosyltransferase
MLKQLELEHATRRQVKILGGNTHQRDEELSPLVSVIIVNYNGKIYLDECLDSLKSTTYQNFEILVVDNNSSDQSSDLIKRRYPYVKLIELKKNQGFAIANNLGAEAAKGDFYIFLNNDTIVTQTWLSELVNAIIESQDNEVAIAQSFLVRRNGEIDSSGDFIDKFGRPYSSKLENPPDGRHIMSARAASMIIKKEVFWKLGGFEEIFFASFEDVHLGWKAWIAGYKVILASNSIVYHFTGQTVKRLKSRMNFHSMKNQACIILLNFEFPSCIGKFLSLIPLYRPSIRPVKRMEALRVSVRQAEEQNPNTIAPEIYSNPVLLKDVLKTFLWICIHTLTLYKKYRQINRMRVRSTDCLRKIGLITNNRYEK